MKKTVAWLLVLLTLGIPRLLWAKERNGADIIVFGKDGSSVRGELIAVKRTSLLLMDWERGRDVSIDFQEILCVTVIKKPKVMAGMGVGLVLGGGVGALVGFTGAKNRSSAGVDAAVVGLFIGVLGLAGGAFLGAIAGIDQTIYLQRDWDEPTASKALQPLLRYARFPDFQKNPWRTSSSGRPLLQLDLDLP